MRRKSCLAFLAAVMMLFSGCSLPYVLSDVPESRENIQSLYKAYQLDKTDSERLSQLISAYKEAGDDKSCIKAYQEYLELVPDDADTWIELAYSQMAIGDYDDAKISCETAIGLDHNAAAYNAMGNIYGDKTEYRKAIEYYRLANNSDAKFMPARTNTLWALYNSEQYDECIREAESQINLDFEYYDLYFYLGASYEAIDYTVKAVAYFEKSLAFEVEDYSNTYYHLGLLSFQNQDYDKAKQYVQNALDENPQSEDALWLSDQLNELDKGLSIRLAEYIDMYYLYKDYYSPFDKRLNILKNEGDQSQETVVSSAETLLHPDDPFSFFVTGSDYDLYQQEQQSSTVSHSTPNLQGNSYELFRITSFNKMTGQEFIKLADAIENKRERTLVFDLRGNTGGDMKACSDILDYLLGDCALVNFIDRKGYVSSYYSSSDKVQFKKYIILTDRQTASASELLTLALKVYQPDTLIIGDTTYGKGVSQIVFDDPRKKVALYLVNSYWNVREINIDGYGITPDQKAIEQNEYDLALKNALSVVQ